LKMIKECTVQKVCGVSFRFINRLPEEAIEKLVQVVQAFEELKQGGDWDKIDAILNFIAGGHMGRVHDLGDYILKVNRPNRQRQYNNRDGYILEQLQGIPMIPTLYAYSEDNTFMVVQKIKGETVMEICCEENFTPSKWNYSEQEALLDKANDEIEKRGWVMDDMHWGNCMIDEEGNMWMVDVGLFHEEDEEGWGKGYGYAIRTLNKAHNSLRGKAQKEAPEVTPQEFAKRELKGFDLELHKGIMLGHFGGNGVGKRMATWSIKRNGVCNIVKATPEVEPPKFMVVRDMHKGIKFYPIV
jgi:tRNA A-37 threonylcarbamoyl transferase component Bud32